MKRFSGLYFVDVLGFCCMDNHFHFLIRMHSESGFTDEEIKERFERFHDEAGDGKVFSDDEIPCLRKKLSSLIFKPATRVICYPLISALKFMVFLMPMIA